MGTSCVVYLLPGLLCDETVWRHQITALAPFATVVVPDFRGMNSFRAMALKVLSQAPLRFCVAGHSMGGRVAMEIMHLAPERIDKFVVMDLGVHPLQAGETAERMVLVELGEQQGMEALADAWIPPMIAPSRRDDLALLAEIRTMVLRSSPADYRAHIEAALTREDQTGYLPAIKHKVLLICGAEDEWSPVAQHEEILRELSHGELIVVPGSGHMVTMEQPRAISRILLDWFELD